MATKDATKAARWIYCSIDPRWGRLNEHQRKPWLANCTKCANGRRAVNAIAKAIDDIFLALQEGANREEAIKFTTAEPK